MNNHKPIKSTKPFSFCGFQFTHYTQAALDAMRGEDNMFFETTARVKNGDYLFHLAQFRELEKSIATAKEWAALPKWSRKGYFAIVRDSQGKLVFDSRQQPIAEEI